MRILLLIGALSLGSCVSPAGPGMDDKMAAMSATVENALVVANLAKVTADAAGIIPEELSTKIDGALDVARAAANAGPITGNKTTDGAIALALAAMTAYAAHRSTMAVRDKNRVKRGDNVTPV